MTRVFDAYAHYYDLLYADKDYTAEAEFVAGQIRKHSPQAKRILELGCGTGSHAVHLARLGFEVHGVDSSDEMLARAEARKSSLPADLAAKLRFVRGDARNVRVPERFDAVISLFHVMSYQTTNADLAAVFRTAAAHSQSGGMFLFDFWYGPSVLRQRPEVRVKRLEDDRIRVTRIAEPAMHVNDNIVDVGYTVFIESKASGATEQVNETHRMRYLFMPELELLANSEAWVLRDSLGWMEQDKPNEMNWAGFVVASLR